MFVEYGNPVQRSPGVLNGSSRLRLEYDSTDVPQFAWDVLFRRFADWGEIQTPDKLMAVLLKIGTNHIRDQLRRFDHEHGGWRQVPLDDERAQAAADRGGLPDDAMAMRDRLEAVLLRRPPEHRQILDLRVKGHTCRGIAGIVGRSAGQVRRVLAEIEQELVG